MNRFLFLAAAALVSLAAQTKLPVAQLAPPAPKLTAACALVYTPAIPIASGWSCIPLSTLIPAPVVPVPFTPQATQVYQLASPLLSVTFSCKAADVHFNGQYMSPGVDFTLDLTGLIGTFVPGVSPGSGAGDVLTVAYRC